MSIFEEINKSADENKRRLQHDLQKELSGTDNLDKDEPEGFRTAGIMFGEMPPSRKASEYLSAAVGWVYACVSAISDSVAQINLELFEIKNGDIVKVEEHAILNLLSKVNRYQTEFDHRSLSQQYLELTGEAPWFLDRGEKGDSEPVSILLLRPDVLKINKAASGSDDPIASYEYNLDPKNKITISPSELIFLKYPDPVNPFRGKGTLQAAAATVDVDTFSEDYNKRFFYNSARPDSVLTTDQKLTAKQRESMLQSLNKLYRGNSNSHKTAILESGLDWKPMSLSQKDMDFLEQQRFSMAKILSIFRVPKPIVAISDDVNLANAKIAEYVFSKWTIRPKMIRIVAQLNEFLLPMFKNTEGMFLSFQDPVPQDIELMLKRHEAGLGKGYMTINEVRSEQGYDTIGPDGDKIYLPISMVPIDEAGGNFSLNSLPSIGVGKARNKKFNYKDLISNSGGGYKSAMRRVSLAKRVSTVNDEKIKKIESSISKIAHTLAIQAVTKQWQQKKKSEADTLEDKRKEKNIAFAKEYLKAADTYERSMRKNLIQQFERQKELVLKKAPKKKVEVDDWLLDEDDESQILVRVLTPGIEQVIKDQGDRAALLVGMGSDAFDLSTRRVQTYLRKRIFKFSFETTQETNRMLGETLRAGVAAGEAVPALRKRVEEMFNGMEKYRSERIARSEVVRASNFGTLEAYKQSKVVEQMEWLVTDDDRLCPWCSPLDGKTVKLDDSFFDKGDTHTGDDGSDLEINYETIEHPPLHPNCRCTIIPIIK